MKARLRPASFETQAAPAPQDEGLMVMAQ